MRRWRIWKLRSRGVWVVALDGCIIEECATFAGLIHICQNYVFEGEPPR